MEISKEAIETVKRSHDLKEVVASYGVSLKKKGSKNVGLCPFHEEKDPSFTVNLSIPPYSNTDSDFVRTVF